MSQVTLRVAGFSYTNNPAGTGGAEYRASLSGSSSDRIWYQVDRSIIYEAVLGEDIREAYLGPQERSALDSAGVTYKTRETVANAGHSNYVLWLVE